MSPFTLDYLARLGTWAALAAALQGGSVWLSWAVWARTALGAPAVRRHRFACLHFAALLLLPALTILALQVNVEANVAAMTHATRCGCVRRPGPWLALYDSMLKLAWPAALVWAAGTAAMAARLALGVWGLRRIETRPAPADAVEQVRHLASRWSACAPPEVVEADVDAPQVIGLRRPRLLLPPRFVERLAPAEREAVLLHELAHVARSDFGWNLAQRLLLALLWPQPAAWLLYRRLRREREIRCDALALGQGATRTALARALVRLAEDRADRARPPLAMALSSQSDLAARLERLVKPAASVTSGKGLPLLAVSMLGACVLALGLGRLDLFDPGIGDAYVASAFGPTVSIAAHDRAGSFSLDIRHGRIVAASLGSRRLTPDRIVQNGGRVVLIGPARKPAVSLAVSPQGEVSWAPRS